MLGQGLESLIPPQGSGAGGDNPQNDGSQMSFILPVHHEGDPEPQILSFDFAAELPPPHDAPPPAEIFRPTTAPAPPPRVIPPPSEPRAIPVAVPVSPTAGLASPAGGTREKTVKKEESTKDRIFHIEVSKIKPNPSQPRRKFAETGIRELAYSIREFGFLQPLVVSKIEHETQAGVDVEYQLIAGERRLLAARMLGLETVPVIVRAVDLEREKLEMAMIENIQREDLSPIETARAFTRLQEEFRMTQREIASNLGKSREVVANTMRLLDLPLYIQEALEREQITESHGRLLLAISDPGAQRKLFDDIVANSLTTRELRERVSVLKPRKHRSGEAISPEIRMMEEKLSVELGTPVKIERGLNNGKIMITFFSEEELEGLISKISGNLTD